MRSSGAYALALQSGHQRARKKGGDAAEDALAGHLDACRRRGIADVVKVPTPHKVIRRTAGASFVGVYTAKAGIDYRGCMSDGRAVFIECKRASAARFYLSAVTELQRAELDFALAGVSLLAVVFRGVPYVFPWAWARGQVRIDLDQHPDYRLHPLRPFLARYLEREAGAAP